MRTMERTRPSGNGYHIYAEERDDWPIKNDEYCCCSAATWAAKEVEVGKNEDKNKQHLPQIMANNKQFVSHREIPSRNSSHSTASHFRSTRFRIARISACYCEDWSNITLAYYSLYVYIYRIYT